MFPVLVNEVLLGCSQSSIVLSTAPRTKELSSYNRNHLTLHLFSKVLYQHDKPHHRHNEKTVERQIAKHSDKLAKVTSQRSAGLA